VRAISRLDTARCALFRLVIALLQACEVHSSTNATRSTGSRGCGIVLLCLFPSIYFIIFSLHDVSLCRLFIINTYDDVLGKCCHQFKRERSRTQRFGDIGDDLLWICHMLVSLCRYIRSECHRSSQAGLQRMVLLLYRGYDAAQQLYQSFHLRRQVS